jgi:tetratricopeptide (TPR) repeat protein
VRSTAKPQAALWVYNPWLDLIVGCGAWTAPLLLLAYFTANTSTRAWALAFYGLALFFNYPHYMATLYRAYHREEDFQKYRIFTVHITALIALTVVLSHFWLRALPFIFTVYLTGSPWHYSGQNYGLFMMFARRAGAKPSETERRALYLAFLVSYLILFTGFHTGLSSDLLFISLGIPETISGVARTVLAIVFVGLSGFGLLRLRRQVGWRAMLPSLMLFSTQFFWFLLPAALSAVKGPNIPQSRYSTGVLAVMHSAQYLWITSFYAQREARAENAARVRPFAYFAVLVAGGIALFIPGPWVASRLFHYDFTTSFLIFTALVNIHHFILDGAIWKLRDGRIAALLVTSQERVSATAGRAGSRVAAGLRWLAGSSAGARRLRVGTAVLLLTWASVDQLRYYFSLHEENLGYLQRAAALAFDTPVQMRLARKELEMGRPNDAIAAWQQAIRANPTNPAPRDALLRYLVGQKRLGEAYELTQQSLRYSPHDADLLVNHGILASQLGHPEAAIASWEKALTLKPAQLQAHLYLAGHLDRQGDAPAAIPHYVFFLDNLAQNGTPPPADQLIPIVLRLADCQIRAGHTGQARQSYELAEKIAQRAGEKKLESLASVNHAELESRDGNISQALRLYQHALKLDATLDDRPAEAADWYGYGLFLRDADFPPRLAYACLVKAESLLEAQPQQSGLKAISAARSELGKVLGGQAAGWQRNPQLALAEALSLTR